MLMPSDCARLEMVDEYKRLTRDENGCGDGSGVCGKAKGGQGKGAKGEGWNRKTRFLDSCSSFVSISGPSPHLMRLMVRIDEWCLS
jgi:hypothetical protein